MSKRLDETIGAVGFDNLINGQYPPALDTGNTHGGSSLQGL